MKRSLSLVAILGAFLLAGCSTPSESNEEVNYVPATPQPIKIGMITPLSGGASTYGQDAVNVATMLLEQLNASGGIDGSEVILVPEDGACNGQSAVGAVQKLINVDGVQAILGGLCSPETISAGAVAQANGVVMVSALSSAPDVSEVGDHVFRYYNDLDAAKTVVAHLNEIGAEKVAAIHINNEYGNAYIDAVELSFDGEVSVREKVNDEEKDFALLAKKVADRADEIDAFIIVMINEAQNVSLIKAFDDEGLLESFAGKIMGSEAFLTDAVLAEVGAIANGLRAIQFPQLSNLDGASGDFVASYKEKYTVESGEVFVVLHAESFGLITDAIREVGNDGSKIATYISSITQDSPRTGLLGDYYFDGADAQALSFVVFEAQDGALVPLAE